MGNAQAAVGIITNDRRYYDCPGCGREVWAYPGYEGNRCWKCPGTLLQGTVRSVVGNTPYVSKVTDAITTTVADTTWSVAKNVGTTVADVVTDNRRYYTCPHCGAEKWAYGMFKGTTCLKCGKIIGSIADGTRKAVVDNTIKPLTNAVAKNVFNKPDAIESKEAEDKDLSDIDKYMNLKIKCVKINSIWLLETDYDNGKISKIGSVVTGTLTNHSLTHQWVSIETEKSDVWFNCQFYGKHLSALKCISENDVTKKAKEHVLKPGKDVTCRKSFCPSNKCMRDVWWYMDKYDGKYSLQDNNCQTFARGLYHELSR